MSIFKENVQTELRKITVENYRECLDLKVTEQQSTFVATNAVSLAEAGIFRYESLPFAVYAGNQMVGFVMLSYDEKKFHYGLWRLMIDQRFQGRGFGKAALQLSIDYLIEEFQAGEIYLTVERENKAAKQLYASFDFEPTGKTEDGEDEMCLVTGEPIRMPAPEPKKRAKPGPKPRSRYWPFDMF
ncbi:hypothetical protein OfM1_09810 [Lactovum odontotermitis]